MTEFKDLTQARMDDYYTVAEAAQVLDITIPSVRNLLYAGRFTTYKFKTITLIARREVHQYQEGRR